MLHHDEEDSYRQFVHGNAAFMRSWPLSRAAGQPEPAPVRVALLPMGDGLAARRGHGGRSRLAVALQPRTRPGRQFVEFMSSEAEQRTAAIDGAHPHRSALWRPAGAAGHPVPAAVTALRGQLLNRSAAGSSRLV